MTATTTLLEQTTAPFNFDSKPAELQAGILQALLDAYTDLSTSPITGEFRPSVAMRISPRDIIVRGNELLMERLADAHAYADDQRADYLDSIAVEFREVLQK